MRKLSAALLLLLVASIPPVRAAKSDVPIAIPTPPGATVTTELNVGREQLLSQLELMSSAFMDDSNGSKIDIGKLKDALGSLDRIQFVQMQLKEKYSTSDLLALFEQKVSGRRIFYDNGSVPGQANLLLATPQDKGYFLAMIQTGGKKGSSDSGKITAARLFGFPDVGKLVTFLADPNILDMLFKRALQPAK